jgi:DNA repair exonuclease SbcCD ATPase subunit
MGDVYAGLDSINMQEQMLFAPAQGDNANRRVEIRQNLNALKARLAANRQLISQLESKLKKDDSKNAVLNKTIAQLKEHIANQEQRISELESQLASANQQISDLNTQVSETQEQLSNETAAKEQAQKEVVDANNELNTVYYAIGTNKELKKQGLLEKKFLGATKVLKEGFNAEYFTKADKRNLSVIPTSGKKIKIWTNMPAGSYEIVTDGNGNQSVKITNASQFWSMTPYLVIQID